MHLRFGTLKSLEANMEYEMCSNKGAMTVRSSWLHLVEPVVSFVYRSTLDSEGVIYVGHYYIHKGKMIPSNNHEELSI